MKSKKLTLYMLYFIIVGVFFILISYAWAALEHRIWGIMGSSLIILGLPLPFRCSVSTFLPPDHELYNQLNYSWFNWFGFTVDIILLVSLIYTWIRRKRKYFILITGITLILLALRMWCVITHRVYDATPECMWVNFGAKEEQKLHKTSPAWTTDE